MAVNLEALRAQLKNIDKNLSTHNSKATIWKPEEGKDYSVRLIALPTEDGSPFIDRWYYYGIGPGGQKATPILAPLGFGLPDPVKIWQAKLFADNSDSRFREAAIKLYPSKRTYAALIVRGEEDKGVRLWSFGKNVLKDLLSLILDTDYGDITDPGVKGRDIKVSVNRTNGAAFAVTKISPRATASRLTDNEADLHQQLQNIPTPPGASDLLPFETIEKRLKDSEAPALSEDAGTEIDVRLKALVSGVGKASPSPKGKSQADIDMDKAFKELEEAGN